VFALGEPFPIRAWPEFGLVMACSRIGDVPEVVVPVTDTRRRARFMSPRRRGGYMANFEIDELEQARGAGPSARIAPRRDIDLKGISASHLHPQHWRRESSSLRPAAARRCPGRWAGPDWRERSTPGS